MKILLRTVILTSVFFCTAALAAPFLAIGDNAEMFLTGTLGVRAEDNIFLSSNGVSDTIFTVTPGVEIKFGKNSASTASFTLSDVFDNYSDHSKLNSNLLQTDFAANYEDGKLKLNFAAGYHELSQNSVDARSADSLSRRNAFNLGGGAEVGISEKTSLALGIKYDRTDYRSRSFSDTDILTVPVDVYFEASPKLAMSVGYRYRDTQQSLGLDSTDHYFNVGARGEFTPKLSGRLTVGYNQRKLSRGGDKTGVGVEGTLAYALSAKTQINFGASNDFGQAGAGDQQKTFSANVGFQSQVADDWQVAASLVYRSLDYYTRTEDYVEGQLSATYTINTYLRLTGAYAHRNNSSPISSGEFSGNVFSLSAILRY